MNTRASRTYSCNASPLTYLFIGSSLLKYYNNSLVDLLRGEFPDITWNEWELTTRLPASWWKSQNNLKRYAEWLGRTLGFFKMEDWYGLTKAHLRDNHGMYSFLDTTIMRVIINFNRNEVTPSQPKFAAARGENTVS